MKIYSAKITTADVGRAFGRARMLNGADIWIDDIRSFRPRRGGNGTEFWAYSDNGTQASAHDRLRSAASWTDYGHVIAHLFNVDSHARIGQYNGEADFVAQVRQYPRTDRGNSLAFLDTLTNIRRYPDVT